MAPPKGLGLLGQAVHKSPLSTLSISPRPPPPPLSSSSSSSKRRVRRRPPTFLAQGNSKEKVVVMETPSPPLRPKTPQPSNKKTSKPSLSEKLPPLSTISLSPPPPRSLPPRSPFAHKLVHPSEAQPPPPPSKPLKRSSLGSVKPADRKRPLPASRKPSSYPKRSPKSSSLSPPAKKKQKLEPPSFLLQPRATSGLDFDLEDQGSPLPPKLPIIPQQRNPPPAPLPPMLSLLLQSTTTTLATTTPSPSPPPPPRSSQPSAVQDSPEPVTRRIPLPPRPRSPLMPSFPLPQEKEATASTFRPPPPQPSPPKSSKPPLTQARPPRVVPQVPRQDRPPSSVSSTLSPPSFLLHNATPTQARTTSSPSFLPPLTPLSHTTPSIPPPPHLIIQHESKPDLEPELEQDPRSPPPPPSRLDVFRPPRLPSAPPLSQSPSSHRYIPTTLPRLRISPPRPPHRPVDVESTRTAPSFLVAKFSSTTNRDDDDDGWSMPTRSGSTSEFGLPSSFVEDFGSSSLGLRSHPPPPPPPFYAFTPIAPPTAPKSERPSPTRTKIPTWSPSQQALLQSYVSLPTPPFPIDLLSEVPFSHVSEGEFFAIRSYVLDNGNPSAVGGADWPYWKASDLEKTEVLDLLAYENVMSTSYSVAEGGFGKDWFDDMRWSADGDEQWQRMLSLARFRQTVEKQGSSSSPSGKLAYWSDEELQALRLNLDGQPIDTAIKRFVSDVLVFDPHLSDLEWFMLEARFKKASQFSLSNLIKTLAASEKTRLLRVVEALTERQTMSESQRRAWKMGDEARRVWGMMSDFASSVEEADREKVAKRSAKKRLMKELLAQSRTKTTSLTSEDATSPSFLRRSPSPSLKPPSSLSTGKESPFSTPNFLDHRDSNNKHRDSSSPSSSRSPLDWTSTPHSFLTSTRPPSSSLAADGNPWSTRPVPSFLTQSPPGLPKEWHGGDPYRPKVPPPSSILSNNPFHSTRKATRSTIPPLPPPPPAWKPRKPPGWNQSRRLMDPRSPSGTRPPFEFGLKRRVPSLKVYPAPALLPRKRLLDKARSSPFAPIDGSALREPHGLDYSLPTSTSPPPAPSRPNSHKNGSTFSKLLKPLPSRPTTLHPPFPFALSLYTHNLLNRIRTSRLNLPRPTRSVPTSTSFLLPTSPTFKSDLQTETEAYWTFHAQKDGIFLNAERKKMYVGFLERAVERLGGKASPVVEWKRRVTEIERSLEVLGRTPEERFRVYCSWGKGKRWLEQLMERKRVKGLRTGKEQQQHHQHALVVANANAQTDATVESKEEDDRIVGAEAGAGTVVVSEAELAQTRATFVAARDEVRRENERVAASGRTESTAGKTELSARFSAAREEARLAEEERELEEEEKIEAERERWEEERDAERVKRSSFRSGSGS